MLDRRVKFRRGIGLARPLEIGIGIGSLAAGYDFDFDTDDHYASV